MQCSETGNGIALQHPIFLGLFGAFLPVVIKSSAHHVTFFFSQGDISLQHTMGSFNNKGLTHLSVCKASFSIRKKKTKTEKESKTWCSGMKDWMGSWGESKKPFSLFVWEAPSSASQRTSSCYDQLDQCLNCLHWIFHSYQTPGWHRWWTSPSFDTCKWENKIVRWFIRLSCN